MQRHKSLTMYTLSIHTGMGSILWVKLRSFPNNKGLCFDCSPFFGAVVQICEIRISSLTFREQSYMIRLTKKDFLLN